MDELLGYNADLICLQELDHKYFKGHFYKGTPLYSCFNYKLQLTFFSEINFDFFLYLVLSENGYEGFFSHKSQSPEGDTAKTGRTGKPGYEIGRNS